MKNTKLSLLMAVMAAVMSWASATASATTLTGAGGTTLGTGTTISAESEGTITYHPVIGDIECKKSSFSGKTTNAGGEGVNVSISLESLSWTECNSTETVLTKGTMSVEGLGSNNGTLSSTATELTIEFAGFHCIFKTTETDLGTLTGSTTTGGNATLDIAATIPRTGGRSGAFCGSTAQWTGSYKFTAPSTLNIDGKAGPVFTGEAPTGSIGETYTVTWKNTGSTSGTVNDETNSNTEVVETTGTACTTIAAGGSCTSRKIKCLKAGESTLTVRDTTAGVEGKLTVKCDEGKIAGEVATGTNGETYTVTWKNTGSVAVTIEDETDSDATVAETLGSGCGTIAVGGSCTSRKVKCLKEGEATLTARDTPAVEGKVTIKCDKPSLEGGPSTGKVGETVTVTWTNNTGSSLVIEDESTSDGTVAETLGSSCGTIASKGSCTSRKIKCLKAGESTITAVDTPSVEGKFVIKCS